MAITTAGWVASGSDDNVYCDDESGLYAVADGVGSGIAGSAAARLFCETIRAYRGHFQDALRSQSNDRQARAQALAIMQQAFNRAAERIYRLAQRRPGYGGMATTGLVLAVGRAGAVLGHVGDSRA